jgi:hypothetical protein
MPDDNPKVPNTPEELFDLQQADPTKKESARVLQALSTISSLHTSPAEDGRIALRLLHKLECWHDSMLEELIIGAGSHHSLIATVAVDADRLMRARLLLDSVRLD